MSELKHTPGPWEAKRADWRNEPSEHKIYISGNRHESYDDDDDDDCALVIVSTAVCIVEGNATSHGVTEANACLIKAAPALLDACQDAAASCPVCEGTGQMTIKEYDPASGVREFAGFVPCPSCKGLREAIALATPPSA